MTLLLESLPLAKSADELLYSNFRSISMKELPQGKMLRQILSSSSL